MSDEESDPKVRRYMERADGNVLIACALMFSDATEQLVDAARLLSGQRVAEDNPLANAEHDRGTRQLADWEALCMLDHVTLVGPMNRNTGRAPVTSGIVEEMRQAHSAPAQLRIGSRWYDFGAGWRVMKDSR